MNQTKRNNTQDFLKIFLDDIPLMDVRAPVEFIQGAFPLSTNIPLLDNEQRQLIGVQYKNLGQDEAIKLGLELATPEIREQRISQWKLYCEQNPQGYLYCFRGGLRSKTTQQWLQDNSIEYPLVEGGYKRMRAFLLSQFEENVHKDKVPLILLSGPTGSGKTKVLNKLRYKIDFEGIAQHRGSAFGRGLAPQPGQIDWENRVSIEFLKQRHHLAQGLPVIVEDEGRLIGRIYLPNYLQDAMKQSSLIILETELRSRVTLIREDYIEQQWPEYQFHFGEDGITEFSNYVLNSLGRIQKRLGGLRYKQIEQLFKQGLRKLVDDNDASGFDKGIELLLTEYYDPMYHYMLEKRNGKVLFRGNEDAIIEWSNSKQQIESVENLSG